MDPTIKSIEGCVWPEPEWQSGLVLAAHALRKKPLGELSPNDLRVAFNEDIGADHLKERVLDVLTEDAVAGDIFDGDLICAVMRSPQFRADRCFRDAILKIADTALMHALDSQTRHDIETLKK
jgi:hypothetical protein